MAEIDFKQYIPLVIAALIGGGAGSTGGILATEAAIGPHNHPAIIKEIREVQYGSEVFKLTTQLEAMDLAGQNGSPSYKVAEAQLIKFTEMLTELDK